jgi:polar amino acid transport system substrate-binding protein
MARTTPFPAATATVAASAPSRRTVLAAGAALALGALLATHAPWAAAQGLAELKQKGTLTVGMLVDFPPYGTTDAQNQPDGYDADVAKLLARDLGVKLAIVPVTGPNRIPFLLTNKVDLLVASLAITPERAKQVAFSQPYAAATIVLYGKKADAVKDANDLKGKRIGVARASTQDIAVTKAAPQGTEIRRFDDDASAMQALLSGQVDAIGCSVTVAAQIAKRAPANTYENKFTLVQQAMGIAMRPGQAELEKAVNDFVARNKANGELNKLYRKWLDTDLPNLQ